MKRRSYELETWSAVVGVGFFMILAFVLWPWTRWAAGAWLVWKLAKSARR